MKSNFSFIKTGSHYWRSHYWNGQVWVSDFRFSVSLFIWSYLLTLLELN